MATVSQIPKILIYEEFDGHPIYRKGHKDFMLGLKKLKKSRGERVPYNGLLPISLIDT